jgi:hypothetical protein
MTFEGGLELGHETRLLELGDGAEHLTDQNSGRRVLKQKPGALAGIQVDG